MRVSIEHGMVWYLGISLSLGDVLVVLCILACYFGLACAQLYVLYIYIVLYLGNRRVSSWTINIDTAILPTRVQTQSTISTDKPNPPLGIIGIVERELAFPPRCPHVCSIITAGLDSESTGKLERAIVLEVARLCFVCIHRGLGISARGWVRVCLW